jgi:hypothetical protein
MASMTMSVELKDLQTMLTKRMASPPQFSVYAILLKKFRYMPSKEIFPNYEVEVFAAHLKKLGDNKEYLIKWYVETAYKMGKRAIAIEKVLDKSAEDQKVLSAKSKESICSFVRDLDMLCLCGHYLATTTGGHKASDSFREATILVVSFVAWFKLNLPDMGDMCTYYLYGTNPLYSRDDLPLRSEMAGAMDDEYLEWSKHSNNSNEFYTARLDKVLVRIGKTFNSLASKLKLPTVWATNHSWAGEVLAQDEKLYEWFTAMNGADELSMKILDLSVRCYILNTLIEIVEDEFDKEDAEVRDMGIVLTRMSDAILLEIDKVAKGLPQ